MSASSVSFFALVFPSLSPTWLSNSGTELSFTTLTSPSSIAVSEGTDLVLPLSNCFSEAAPSSICSVGEEGGCVTMESAPADAVRFKEGLTAFVGKYDFCESSEIK